MSIRLYVRSIHRVLNNTKTIILDLVDISKHIMQITSGKDILHKNLIQSREKLEKKREIINSQPSDYQRKTLNFVR